MSGKFHEPIWIWNTCDKSVDSNLVSKCQPYSAHIDSDLISLDWKYNVASFKFLGN